MAIAVRERCMAALAALLAGVEGVVAVERNRRSAVGEADALPRLVLREGGQTPPDFDTGLAHYRMDVPVEAYVEAAEEAALGPAATALYAAIVAALDADPSLGGVAVDTIEGGLEVEPDVVPGHAPNMAFLLTVVVEYATRAGDPYTLAP